MSDIGRILVVDDTIDAREAVTRVLRNAGYSVYSAGNGEDSLRLLAEIQVDLVLLDIVLPDIDGLEVCRRLKQDRATDSPYIVLCTSKKSTSENITEGFAIGADGYIVRPISNSELLARVQGFLRHKQTLDRLHASETVYRSLFEGSPLPIWIVSERSRQMLAANMAALVHYGYAKNELHDLSLTDLFEKEQADSFWRKESVRSAGPLKSETCRQRCKNGLFFDAYVFTHSLIWENESARAVTIVDITQRIQLEAEKARQEKSTDDELKSLAQMSSGSEMRVTAKSFGLAPLSEVSPQLFVQLGKEYDKAIQRAMDQQIYRNENQLTPKLRNIAEQLFFLLAGPRDVVELHRKVIKNRIDNEPSNAVQGYLEVGRMTVLELMGHLAAAYRNSYVPKNKKSASKMDELP